VENAFTLGGTDLLDGGDGVDGVEQRPLETQSVQPAELGNAVACPRVGGLHNVYEGIAA
jgi:hypothetical protein